MVLSSYRRLFNVSRKGWIDLLNAARELTLVEANIVDITTRLFVSYTRLLLHVGDDIVSSNGEEY